MPSPLEDGKCQLTIFTKVFVSMLKVDPIEVAIALALALA